jgi:hypothetical protein
MHAVSRAEPVARRGTAAAARRPVGTDQAAATFLAVKSRANSSTALFNAARS